MSNYKILAIDFDQTIHDQAHPVPGRKMGPPIVGAQDAIVEFKRRGYKIIIHTVWGSDDRKQAIIDWLNYYQIYFDEVTNIKPKADAYIDDKAIRFTTWEEVKTLV